MHALLLVVVLLAAPLKAVLHFMGGHVDCVGTESTVQPDGIRWDYQFVVALEKPVEMRRIVLRAADGGSWDTGDPMKATLAVASHDGRVLNIDRPLDLAAVTSSTYYICAADPVGIRFEKGKAFTATLEFAKGSGLWKQVVSTVIR